MRSKNNFKWKNKFNLILLLFVLYTFIANSQNKLQIMESFDSIEVSSKSYEEAKNALKIIKEAPIFLGNKREIANNCENRAQFAYSILEKLGFSPANYWLFKEGLVEERFATAKKVKRSTGLAYNTGIGRKPYVFWIYHVATGITIKRNGKEEVLIYDPWTQNKLVTLKEWSLSFYREKSGRTAYVMSVRGLYNYFGTNSIGQVSIDQNDWNKKIGSPCNQMYCGLAGITPNKKCCKKRFHSRILAKKNEIDEYLNLFNLKI